MKAIKLKTIVLGLLGVILTPAISFAANDSTVKEGSANDSAANEPSSLVPNLKENKAPLTVNKGNFVAAPIPFSNPTIDSGLAGLVGYFYPQTDEQKSVQPPSVTGIAGFYSSNDSWGAAVGHASYWDNNNWHLKGGVAYADLKLPLVSTELLGLPIDVDWDISGYGALLELERRISGNWFVGVNGVFIDFEQDFNVNISSIDFDLRNEIVSAGLGAGIIYDSRDVPTNPYDGYYFKLNGTFFDDAIGSDTNFESYSLEFDGYFPVHESITVAYKLKGCLKEGNVPLWAACRLGLRGFSSTEYMALGAIETEAEARWRFHKRWGLVGFIGAGKLDDVNHADKSDDIIPSYGIGVRFMLQPAERINLRLDYARSSNNNDALYLSVGEAF
ncbi:BamA/TamA family outer membrane protein [Shewanella sp. 6_MG-2023]|uniref:BamA/TamA family outer membrane protein n=1 Tax=Shewanella sp. 6_MG-2023 TaxID=3062660 RepID=UPI0026E4834C|nr:BamA/TamA family outer membrane protein [Shewanella sp. 6_MG-2023]MDO6619807.1 BamA/TamA family outer membrane protein [Shewanella sp. 6_MG-2023]